MIDHDIVRLHIAMHDTLTMAEVQRFEELIDIVADIVVGESRIERAEVGIVHILEHQTRGFALTVADHIQQSYHVGTTCQILKNLDLTLNLLLLNWFEDLDDTLLVVDHIDALEDFRVLSTAYSSDC